MTGSSPDPPAGKDLPPAVSLYEVDAAALFEICDSIPIGIIALDTETTNPAFANRHFLEFSPAQQKQIVGHILRRLNRKSAKEPAMPLNEEVEIRENGQRSVFGFTIYPARKGTTVVFVSDIASKSILMQSRQDNQFFDRFSDMVAEVAHEIGNPLTGITTILQVLRLNIAGWPREKIDDYLHRCISEIDRLNAFLNRIRDISGETAMDIQPVVLRDLLMSVYERNRVRFEIRKVAFHCRVDSNVCVRVDEGAFYQILLNLVNNSLNFLKAGQEVDIYLESVDKSFVSMVFCNNGPSIPEEDLERIFSPFFTTRETGEGIGLTISLKLITRMGGLMLATPPLEGQNGARFVIHIPRGDCP
ncbi:MAG: HAMP domain-containing histidine kinase [Candidatus Aminicenantes bacterium]|nr:HAMP domain-containing histidine kinase [Candidatus Aminicenantes bacterium]